MDFFSVLTLFGGLAMFLYGMDIMGEGLKKLSGSKLEMILEKLTANKFLGFLYLYRHKYRYLCRRLWNYKLVLYVINQYQPVRFPSCSCLLLKIRIEAIRALDSSY